MERGNRYLKQIDRYVGILVVWILGIFRPRNRKISGTPRRIAIIKGAAIGDTVLLSAIVQDIRAQLPDVELYFFCGKTCVDIAELIPGITEVCFIPTTKPFQAIWKLRRAGRFDIVIDAGPWTRLEALFTYFVKGNYKIGFKSLNQFRHYGYDLAVEHSNLQHELENNRNLIRPFIRNPAHWPALKQTVADPERVRIKHGLVAPFWVLHAWSGGYKGHYKEWVDDRWAELADYLTKQGYTVAFSGVKSNAEHTARLVEQCSSRGVSAVNLAGKTSLEEIIAILRVADGVVSVNTGIMHIAAALDTPVVAINGPVPTGRWGAVSKRAVNIDAKGADCGYIHLGFEYPVSPPDCMGSISIDEVKAAIKELNTIKSLLSHKAE